MSDDCCYHVDRIDDDCFDLYVSDDGGYTWEFYNWYDSFELADVNGRDVVEEVKGGYYESY